MLTREEILEVITYCSEHKITQQQRIDELGISRNSYYWWKRKYQDEDKLMGNTDRGEFIQLPNSGRFVPAKMPPAKTSGIAAARRTNSRDSEAGRISVELCSPSGMTMRIDGMLTAAHLRELISSVNV